MAKHAKPTFARTIKKSGARSTAALAMATVGLLAAGPIASAGVSSDDAPHKHHKHDGDVENNIEHSESEGLINVSDNNAQVPIQVCNNYVPINVLGVQVPIEEISGISLGLLAEETNSEADHGDYCEQPSAQEN